MERKVLHGGTQCSPWWNDLFRVSSPLTVEGQVAECSIDGNKLQTTMSAYYDLFEKPDIRRTGEQQPLYARFVPKGTIDKKNL